MEWFLYTLLIVLVVSALALLAYLFRGRAIEHRLALLDAIADLSQRVHLLEDAIHSNGTAPLERKLDLLAQRLNAIDARLVVAAASPSPDDGDAGPSPTSDRAIALRALRAQGFEAVRVVSEEDVTGGVRELRIETWREGVLLKGSVLVAKGAVVEKRLSPVFELFP